MNIALLHFRVGETDGVSLEMDKWRHTLNEIGHKTSYIAGEHSLDALVIPEISINSEVHKAIYHNSYVSLDSYGEQELINIIKEQSSIIKQKLVALINENNIQMIIINNASSLGLHLPTGLALKELTDSEIVEVVYHHHDFYWERERYSKPTIPFVSELLSTCFPPKKGTHVVINKIAQSELLKRKGLASTVVPNVFDFNMASWSVDNYNKDLRSKLDLNENDLVLLQATRIEDRKGIEMAIDFTRILADNTDKRVVLVMVGLQEMEVNRYDVFLKYLEESKINYRIASDLFSHERDEEKGTYSLWDAYTIADLVTYPSILEGFGNQLIEALFAKKLVFVYQYPVYKTDIKDKGFKFLEIPSIYKTKENGLYEVPEEELIELVSEFQKITNNEYEEIVSRNFEIAKENYSYEVLRNLLEKIV